MPLGIPIRRRLLHQRNASLPTVFNRSGKSTVFRFLQPLNAQIPILSSPEGKTASERLRQSKKAPKPIPETPSGSTIFSRLTHCANALSSTFCTLFGTVTLLSAVQPLKTEFDIFVTPSGITKDCKAVQPSKPRNQSCAPYQANRSPSDW